MGSKKHKYYKDQEESHLETVFLAGDSKKENSVNVTMKLRYNRKPVVGDKFSSRHG